MIVQYHLYCHVSNFACWPNLLLNRESRERSSVMSIQLSVDDTFELYDLRVEAICPQGKRILCGAQTGDYFWLEGEMLHLPPGQGFSIYSLGSCFSAFELLCR